MIRARMLFVAALAISANAHAWDPAGHMLVGQIAWTQTKPEVRARVEELAAKLENTYNNGQPYNFITTGTWMDDMRSKKGYAWSKWHYVNLDWTADGVAFALPEPPHVVWAIGESLKMLKAADTAPDKAAEALAMMMHFVGDLHQPMHATDRGDRGGNGILIMGVPFTDLWPGTKANLHAYWDKAFRFDNADGKIAEAWQCPPTPDRPMSAESGVIAEQAAKIIAKYPCASLTVEIAQMDPVEWARESHKLGCLSGYPADFVPSDNHVVELTGGFAARSRTIAERQVALAGYRLASVLNDALAR
ncbi:MAG: S1/P1 nuclease [Chthoniobacteraceae bacterium]